MATSTKFVKFGGSLFDSCLDLFGMHNIPYVFWRIDAIRVGYRLRHRGHTVNSHCMENATSNLVDIDQNTQIYYWNCAQCTFYAAQLRL